MRGMRGRAGSGVATVLVVTGFLAGGAAGAEAAAVRSSFKLAPEVGYAVHADGFGEPRGLLVSPAGALYVADASRNEVVQIARDGRRTVAARDVPGAYKAAIDPLGFLYVAAANVNRVIKVSPQGVASVYLEGLSLPVDLAFSQNQELLVCEMTGNTIRAFTSPRQGRVLARVQTPFGLVVTRDGVVLLAESGPGRILKVHPDGRAERWVEGLERPEGMAIGPSGDLYVVEPRAGRISRIRPDGSRQAVAEGLAGPRGPAFDAYGQLFVSETAAGRVLRFTGDF